MLIIVNELKERKICKPELQERSNGMEIELFS